MADAWGIVDDGYISLERVITRKAYNRIGMRKMEAQHYLQGIRREIYRHLSFTQNLMLSRHDLVWLTELTFWERWFRPDKDPFPGIRAPNAFHYPMFQGYISCEVCEVLKTPEDRCPLLRFVPCPNDTHEDYKQRVGYELEGCGKCRQGRVKAEEQALSERALILNDDAEEFEEAGTSEVAEVALGSLDALFVADQSNAAEETAEEAEDHDEWTSV